MEDVRRVWKRGGVPPLTDWPNLTRGAGGVGTGGVARHGDFPWENYREGRCGIFSKS